ncbi:MAG: thioredoxin fold domain-containing protein [Gammaproteobacteria bacterium]
MLLVIMLISEAVFSGDRSGVVPPVRDLYSLSKVAEARNLPILLMVSQDHCPYCELLKEEILNPMVISGDYINKAVMSVLTIDASKAIIDFNGKKIEPRDVALRYNATITPTLLFLDYQGNEIQERMTGVNTVEMYGYYLDESIDEALEKLKQSKLSK